MARRAGKQLVARCNAAVPVNVLLWQRSRARIARDLFCFAGYNGRCACSAVIYLCFVRLVHIAVLGRLYRAAVTGKFSAFIVTVTGKFYLVYFVWGYFSVIFQFGK